MDSHFVEWLNIELATQYPELARVIGNENARTELKGYLGDLVINNILDPTDAREIEVRLWNE